MKNLGIQLIYQGHEHKLQSFNEIIEILCISPDQAAHIGDDLLDLPIMTRVGLAIAVSDANFAVKQRAHWCTTELGGHGAVREACDLIMQAQGSFEAILNSYLK